MSRSIKHGTLFLAALAIGMTAATADAAFVAAYRSSARVVNPGLGRGGAVVHGGATAVHATLYRPAAGPTVAHASRTVVR
jgi:hypothetical protein